MDYIKLTPDIYRKLKVIGFKYLVQGKQLSNEQVGYEEDTFFSHFEVWPALEEPVTQIVYDPIDSPESVDMINGIDEVVFWVDKKYNNDVLS